MKIPKFVRTIDHTMPSNHQSIKKYGDESQLTLPQTEHIPSLHSMTINFNNSLVYRILVAAQTNVETKALQDKNQILGNFTTLSTAIMCCCDKMISRTVHIK
jgi:hypothetical protein